MWKIQYYQTKFNIPILEPDTDEFLESRKFAFGGSEVATVLGINEYEDLNSLVNKKQNKINTHNEATLWGKIFEPIAKIFISKKYGKVYNFGSIPHPMFPISYSPDGLIMNETKDDIILIEIKCPCKRDIYSIPHHYKAQVYTGLNIFNASQCLFIQFKFRRCKIDTAPWSSKYDNAFHFDYRSKRCINTPKSYGYLYWALPKEIYEGIIDLSTMEDMNDTIQEYKQKYEEGKENVKLTYESILERPYNEDCNGLMLMWKLFDINEDFIDRDLNYLIQHEKELWEAYQKLIKK
jgi:putative phage-type endonuclease